MSGYLPRRERQAKQASLIQNIAGPLRFYLPDSWIHAAGGVSARVAAFPPSGHGLVDDSASPLSRPVMPGYIGLAPGGKGTYRSASAFT